MSDSLDRSLITGRLRRTATLPERGWVVPELGEPDIREIIFRSYCRQTMKLLDHKVERGI